MGRKRKKQKKEIKSKTPDKNDNKIKAKTPKSKVPKDDGKTYFPPAKKTRTTIEDKIPKQSVLENEKKNNQSLPKTKIPRKHKVPSKQNYKYFPEKKNKKIPKDHIKEKKPKKDTLTHDKMDSFVPPKSSGKDKQDVVPSKSRIKKVSTLKNRALKREKRKKTEPERSTFRKLLSQLSKPLRRQDKEETLPNDDSDLFTSPEIIESQPVPDEPKRTNKKERSTPVTTKIREKKKSKRVKKPKKIKKPKKDKKPTEKIPK